MDFWSRLIAGTSFGPATGSKATASNPEKRLARFKREYNQLLQIWRNVPNLSRDHDAAERVRFHLQELTSILGDESRRPLPHTCITFVSSNHIYISISKITTVSYSEAIIREGVGFFATLIDSEEEDFVENESFSKSLMNLLVRITGAQSIPLSQETEVDVVELSFNITTKIRLDPEILPAWFTVQHDEETEMEDQDAHEKFTGKTHKEDFPLFYLLIDFIHHEGRTGDFARTGLLYIIEAAANSVSLEQWIVESDLATLMATGLGALYSQLSRKLVIDYPTSELPPILALSDYRHPVATIEIVSSASPDYQSHMDTFLSHLMFWQDVLNHCKSIEVKQTLLEHFQVIFLQQLLYPSLLESSDMDGGSAVAVLTYLRRILESLDHPDMIHLILHYLLALPDTTTAPLGPRPTVSAARKRKSMDLASMVATQAEVASEPILFNLVDLIQGSLRSHSPQTVSVTLQLVSIILRRHHRYAVTTLLRTTQLVDEEPQRTIGAHEKEMSLILTLAGDLGGDTDFEELYESHVKDGMNLLESHPCSIPLIVPTAGGAIKSAPTQPSVPGAPRNIRMHTLRAEDPMLKTLIGILGTFLLNPVEVNLSLTGTIIDLATCGFMRIDGWLLPDPSGFTFEEEDELEEEDPSDLLTHRSSNDINSVDVQENVQLRALKRAQRPPNWSKSQLSDFLIQLETLVAQVAQYRSEIPRFDELLQQRREAFQTAEAVNVKPITAHQSPARSTSDSPRSASPSRPSAFDSLAQRIFPDFGTPSRSRSPRGRKSQEKQHGNETSGGVGVGSPAASRGPLPPAQFPMGLETPSKGTPRTFSTSPLRDSSLPNRMQGALPSQVAAFAAVDQSILARKVGIPPPNAEITPIPFPSLRGEPDATKPDEPPVEEGAPSAEDAESELGDLKTERAEELEEQKQASVSHVLTNILILQEFLFELAALVQVRAGLFAEVRFI